MIGPGLACRGQWWADRASVGDRGRDVGDRGHGWRQGQDWRQEPVWATGASVGDRARIGDGASVGDLDQEWVIGPR